MSNENMTKPVFETEKTHERKGIFVARLGDLGLGNPKDGIPSGYAEANGIELGEIATQLTERLREPTDLTACSCIDGRHTLCNADGSKAEVRLRRVGGSASNFGVALNAEASIIETLDSKSGLGDQIKVVDDATGFERSAHLGGCGGANGEEDDHKAIHENSAILAAVKTFMEIPEVREYLEVGYDDELGERVRQNAGETAKFLQAAGWEGQKYVDGVMKTNRRGVEELEVDPDDEKFHGHKENSIAVIIGDKTLDVDDEFVWNLSASKKVATALAGRRGEEGYTQAIIAEIAKHFAVANRLPGRDTPIFLLQG